MLSLLWQIIYRVQPCQHPIIKVKHGGRMVAISTWLLGTIKLAHCTVQLTVAFKPSIAMLKSSIMQLCYHDKALP